MSTTHHRRFALFLGIVLVPAVVLVAASIRLVDQERELAAQRRERSAELLAQQLGQELALRLARVREQSRSADDSPRAGAVLAARTDGERLMLPWEAGTAMDRSPPAPALEAAVAAGARAEFVDRRYADAAAFYQEAARLAPHRSARADALLMAARATARAGGDRHAVAQYRALLAEPFAARDEEGFPYAIYAADALISTGAAQASAAIQAEVLTALAAAAERRDLAPMVLHAVTDLGERFAASVDGPLRDSTHAVARTAAAARHTAERAAALQRDFATLRSLAVSTRRGGAADHETVWLPFGEEPWLVGVPAAAELDSAHTVLVARPDEILAQIATGGPLAAAAAAARLDLHGTGPALGTVFPGVRVEFGDFPPVDPAGFGRVLLLFVLPAVTGALAFTAYLLWRDVRREVEAAALRSQFVASVSHELKTPLTSIRMFTELIRFGHAPADRHAEYLEVIGSETERLTRLINNVLDLSRIEREGRAYRREEVSLCEVVRDAARIMAYPLAQDGFELRLAIDDATPRIHGDRDAIAQAVLNLLSNAVKFSGSSRVVELDLARQNGAAVIRVTDGGCGIEPAEQQAIFRTFYRSPSAEAAGIPGTGIGLALVAHVAAGHGGRVDVASRPGRGSTFSLILPASET